jgi:hypothetical protein
MLAKGRAFSGRIEKEAGVGDLTHTGEFVATLTTAGSGNVLAAAIAAGILDRTGPAGGFTDTFDSATSILAAVYGSAADANTGDSWRFLYRNGVAFAMTAAIGEGIVLVNANVAASVIREYLLRVLNATPRQTYICQTATSVTVTGFTAAQLATLSVGMMASGSGVVAGSTIATITPATGTLTLSVATTTTVANNALTFSPTLEVRGLGVMTA